MSGLFFQPQVYECFAMNLVLKFRISEIDSIIELHLGNIMLMTFIRASRVSITKSEVHTSVGSSTSLTVLKSK